MGRTGYHILDISPWPFGVAWGALGVFCSFISYLHEGVSSLVVWGGGGSVLLCFLSIFHWWSDIIVESTYLGGFTTLVIRNLRVGFILFLVSEGVFFAGFFWAYLYAACGELSIMGVGQWPPVGINPIYAWNIPLFNMALLLTSGGCVNAAYKSAKVYNIIPLPVTWNARLYYKQMKSWHRRSIVWLFLSIVLGVVFLCVQYSEFYIASFTIADSVYGSAFYMLTGLHGFHVLFGVCFLSVMLGRLYYHHFSFKNFYFGLTASVWYWHFVDGVWVAVFAIVYAWGNA